MQNITEFEMINPITQEVKKHVAIEKDDGGAVTMPKAVWDEQQAQKELGGTL